VLTPTDLVESYSDGRRRFSPLAAPGRKTRPSLCSRPFRTAPEGVSEFTNFTSFHPPTLQEITSLPLFNQRLIDPVYQIAKSNAVQ
jgi:hypothetical protein